jgi:hypothetical protein
LENALGNATAKSAGAVVATTSARTARATTENVQLCLPREATPIVPAAIPSPKPPKSNAKLISAIEPVLLLPPLEYDV